MHITSLGLELGLAHWIDVASLLSEGALLESSGCPRARALLILDLVSTSKAHLVCM
jgi:hypothetical protein